MDLEARVLALERKVAELEAEIIILQAEPDPPPSKPSLRVIKGDG